MTKQRFCIGVAALCCAINSLGAQRPLAFTHVTVIDGRGGEPIRDGVVVVRGDRIAAVGPAATPIVPRGARIIDGRGKSLLPGLADMHVHLTGGWDGHRSDLLGYKRYLNALLYAGVTTVLDVGNVLPYVQQLKQEVAAGRLTGPRILMAGPLIDGPRPFWPPLSYAVSSPEQLPTYVKQLAREGVDVLKAYGGLTTDQIRQLVEAARAESLQVIVDAHARNGTIDVARTGVAAFAHVAATPISDEALAYMKEQSVASITTLAVRESFAARRFADSASLAALMREPLVRESFPAQFAQELRTFADSTSPAIDSARITSTVRLKTSLANVKRMFEGGILLVAGTDAPYPGDFYGEGLHRELELLVEAGLTPLQAITAATRNAAMLLHHSSEWGTIEAGKRADLLMVAGDPSRRIRDTRNISLVMQGGRLIDRMSLRADNTRDPSYRTSGSVAAAPQAAVQPRAIALRNVTIIDVESGERLPDRTVLLRGDRIAAVLSPA
ncbi:MAG: amidohydrolase family protein, partial [Gemmatimonadaceae bacterium]